MATFSDYVKNIFWVLLLIQFAPFLIKGIQTQYSDMFEEKTRVGVISLKGSISSSETISKHLKTFFNDKTMKAIVFKINSGGGIAPTTQAIFLELLHYKKQHPEKYVISYIEQIGASGAYYIATGTDYIVATPSALIGSIGSAIRNISLKNLLERLDVNYSLIQSGEYKGTGDPFLALTPEERNLLQEVSDTVYKQFIRDVTSQRPQLPSDTKLWAEGKIFSGEQAFGLKLIDETGSPATVEKTLREKAQIVGRIEWVKPLKKRSFLANLFAGEEDEEGTSYLRSAVNTLCSHIEARYTHAASCVRF